MLKSLFCLNKILKKLYFFYNNSYFIKRGLLCLAIAFTIFNFVILLPRTFQRTDPWRDVVAYYLAKENIEAKLPLYEGLHEHGPHDRSQPFYLYPPILASALAIMPQVKFLSFARLWTLFLYGAFWIYAVSLGKLATGKASFSGSMVAGLFLFIFPGTYRALELGQIDPLLWSFFGLALTLPKLRGFFLMAISVIKPWGVWPFLWSLGKNYSVFLGAGVVLGGSILIGTLIMGTGAFWENCWLWFTHVLPSLSQGAWSPDNRSLSFGVLRIFRYFGLWKYNGGTLPFWSQAWLLLCGIVGPILTGLYLRHNSKNVQLSAVACSAILFSPIFWTTYIPIFLTLIVTIFHEKCKNFLD